MSIRLQRNILLRWKPNLPTSSVSGPETQGQPMAGQCGGEESMNAFLDRELVHHQSLQGPFPLLDAGKGIRKLEEGSSALAWPLNQGKPLEIKVKTPRCCPEEEAGASKGLVALLQLENREEVVGEVSRKTPSFHGGDGGGSLMSSTTIPEQILFIELSLTKGNRGLRFFPHFLIFSLPLSKQIHVK